MTKMSGARWSSLSSGRKRSVLCWRGCTRLGFEGFSSWPLLVKSMEVTAMPFGFLEDWFLAYFKATHSRRKPSAISGYA